MNALIASDVNLVSRIAPPDFVRLQNREITMIEMRAEPGGSNCVMRLGFNLDS